MSRNLLQAALLALLLATHCAGRVLHKEDPDAGEETDGDIVGDRWAGGALARWHQRWPSSSDAPLRTRHKEPPQEGQLNKVLKFSPVTADASRLPLLFWLAARPAPPATTPSAATGRCCSMASVR